MLIQECGYVEQKSDLHVTEGTLGYRKPYQRRVSLEGAQVYLKQSW
jgi:hypothetical protein